jgi:hypothetical protein
VRTPAGRSTLQPVQVSRLLTARPLLQLLHLLQLGGASPRPSTAPSGIPVLRGWQSSLATGP